MVTVDKRSAQAPSALWRFLQGRPDLLLHALAQLPEEFEAEFPEGAPGGLSALARAYGVGNRVRFGRLVPLILLSCCDLGTL